MTIAVDLPRRPLTVADWDALPEETDQRWELLEGYLVMTPSPNTPHGVATVLLRDQLVPTTPDELFVLVDLDLNLQLAPPDGPATIRRPDVFVVTRAGIARTRREGGVMRANECLLAVEILSPGSRRTDRIIKFGEYADAGIPNYWILDLDDGPSLTVNELVDGRYVASEPLRGRCAVAAPFPVELDLSALQ